MWFTDRSAFLQHFPPHFLPNGLAESCAFYPNLRVFFLHMYKLHKNGKNPLNLTECSFLQRILRQNARGSLFWPSARILPLFVEVLRSPSPFGRACRSLSGIRKSRGTASSSHSFCHRFRFPCKSLSDPAACKLIPPGSPSPPLFSLAGVTAAAPLDTTFSKFLILLRVVLNLLYIVSVIFKANKIFRFFL